MLLYSFVKTTLEVSTRGIRVGLCALNANIKPSLETLQINLFQLLDFSQRMKEVYSDFYYLNPEGIVQVKGFLTKGIFCQ